MIFCDGLEFDAVIFDLDGTLIDSTDLWAKIDQKFFSSRGMEVPPHYSEQIAHIGLQEAAKFTKETYNIKDSVEDILNEWLNASKDFYYNEVALMPYALDYIKYLKKNKVKIALATANSKDIYEPCLKRLGVYDYFDLICDVDVVSSGKNTPKLYKKISSVLDVDPSKTIVLEDIYIGLKTALENGYYPIAFCKKENKLVKKYSKKQIYSYQELIDENKR